MKRKVETESSPEPSKRASTKGDATLDLERAAATTKEALDNGEYNMVIDNVGSVISEMQDKMTQFLKMRAVAWAKNQKFAKELEDAASMMEYSKNDPAGYLCAGNRYMAQGFQKQAVDIFNQGLKNVPPTNTQYQALLNGKQRAEEQQRKKIDFLGSAPYEIMCHIVTFIPQDTLAEITKISRNWRQRLLDYPECWRRVHGDRTTSAYQLLPRICEHVQDLCLLQAHETPKCLDLIKKSNFANLRSFQIRENVFFDKHCRLSLCTSLARVADTLTTLDVVWDGKNTPRLTQILSTCRNLTTIRFGSATRDPWTFNDLDLPFQTALTKVVLLSAPLKLDASYLQPFFRCSPKIRFLALDSCNTNICTSIKNYCHNINILILNDSIDLADRFYKPDLDDTPGLQALELNHLFSGTNLMPLLAKHHRTLQTLNIIFPSLIDPFGGDWRSLSAFSLPRLTDLTLQGPPVAVVARLATILDRCPNLETFSVRYSDDELSDEMFSVAIGLKQLKKVLFESVEFSTRGILPFLKAHHKETSQLTSLALLSCDTLEPAVLTACTGIKSLTRLHLNSLTPELTIAESRQFSIGIAQMPKLTLLELRQINLTEENLQVIGKSKSLRSIEMHSNTGLTLEEFRNAVPDHIAIRYQCE